MLAISLLVDMFPVLWIYVMQVLLIYGLGDFGGMIRELLIYDLGVSGIVVLIACKMGLQLSIIRTRILSIFERI